MPELPEVETTRKGISPYVTGKPITRVQVLEKKLRWPVPNTLSKVLHNQVIQSVDRRAKYLLFRLENGTLIVHLGMSGSLRIEKSAVPLEPHEHIVMHFSDLSMRYRDPRKFGAFLWTFDANPYNHKLLKELGPEPLSDELDGEYLHRKAKGRSVSVKDFIMNSRIVVGVGNIYATEALFEAGIHPARSAGQISLQRYKILSDSIKNVLTLALAKGGTTLRDFIQGDGRPGYFRHVLKAYGRAGQPCVNCAHELRGIRQGQRSTVYCVHCQR